LPGIELGGIAWFELGGMPMLFGGIPPTGVTDFGGMLGGCPLECVTEGPKGGLGEILP